MKLDVKAFALACALIWGLGLFFLTSWIILLDGTSSNSNELSLIYRGYRITPVGSLIGFAWAFFDGLIGGALFAWLYNRLAKPKTQSKSSATDPAEAIHST